MKINNIPEYAKDRKFIVCSIVEYELWFYGAYDDYDRAKTAAEFIGGVIL